MRRNALSLIEVLVAVAVLGVLIALLLPAIQSARMASLRTRSLNNLRQVMLGLYTGSESPVFRGRLGGYAQAKYATMDQQFDSIRGIPGQFNPHILAWHGIEGNDLKGDSPNDLLPYFLSPADPTLVGRVWTDLESVPRASVNAASGGLVFHDGGPTSYAFNMTGFLGPARPGAIGDGSSQTIAFAEKYFETRPQEAAYRGTPARSWMTFRKHGCAFDGQIPGKLDNLNERRPSFADAGWGDVVPVTAGGVSRPSVPGLTFQSRPLPADADMRLCQTPFPGGLPVALFDGSARLVGTAVSPEAFWGAVTPAAADAAGLD